MAAITNELILSVSAPSNKILSDAVSILNSGLNMKFPEVKLPVRVNEELSNSPDPEPKPTATPLTYVPIAP